VNLNLDLFQISESASLREALEQIELNHHGVIFAVNVSGAVSGLATDGDIRRKLLQGSTLDERVSSCINLSFVWAEQSASKELLLKQLDSRIRAIPILDEKRRLIALVTRDHIPLQAEGRVYARARSPVRISFGGGGSDLTHYFAGDAGAVINTTVSLYSHATLRLRDDLQICVHSSDLDATLTATDLSDALQKPGLFGLIQALLKVVHPEFGFELYLHSDSPMRSGLGGSAVVSAAVLGCFNQFRQDRWDAHELAELAFQAERMYLGIAGGWQDQYASVFGGFNFMEFRMEQNIVHPLRIHPDTILELEESLVLCDTGTLHDSGDIHHDQRQHMDQKSVREKVQANVELTYKMRNYLLRGRLLQLGEALHEAWLLKRQFSTKISNDQLDNIYETARACGAVGGKLLGAGGGGFFLFYTTPFRKLELMNCLKSLNLRVQPFRFERDGLQAWTARERTNTSENL
jgi:D-glycero-alpha-D-manno-heptose-7-phosphate kinase